MLEINKQTGLREYESLFTSYEILCKASFPYVISILVRQHDAVFTFQ